MAVRADAHPPRYAHSPLLDALIAEVERLAVTVATADDDARSALRAERRVASIRATLSLEGAPLADIPDVEVARATVGELTPADPPPADRVGGWLDALRALDDPSDTQVRAFEVLGAAAAAASDDLAATILHDPHTTLRELHRRTTRGLVAADRAGEPRTTEQAVHDASIGRILFFTTAPADIAGELAALCDWLIDAGPREHGLVLSGVLHHELLRIHPFDAANGRVARSAARLVLRASGLDPDALAAPEPLLARDAMGYHDEVARTRRRRDLTIWIERWSEAVADALRSAARHLEVLPVDVPDRAARFVAQRSPAAFTLADYRTDVAVDREAATTDLRALLDAGRISRVPGSRGLRYLVLDS